MYLACPCPGHGTVVRLQLLGGFELTVEGRPLAVPRSAQRVLVLLALQRRPLQRVFLAGTLWLESDEERANASLRSALWRLQRLPCTLVRATHASIGLADQVRVDVEEVSEAARRVLSGVYEADALHRLSAADELLPDWYEDWLEIDRERVRQRRLHALDAACAALVRAGRFSEAAEVGLASVAAEPLRESAHRALIELHLAEGNVVEAVRQYEVYRRLAISQLGLEPSIEMRAVLDRTEVATLTPARFQPDRRAA
jgi:DNA-binding SARP family transcriptional activator